MERKLNIRSFGNSWINCATNEQLTLLTTIDSSYEKAALMNSYFYFIENPYNEVSRLNLFHSEEFHKSLEQFVYTDLNINQKNLINELKKNIDQGNVIKIYADLFFWIENSFDYGKRHSLNYELITGYNDEERCFFSICDNLDGYMENKVTYENLSKAFTISDIFPPQIINYKDNIPPYRINGDELMSSAEKIISSIDSLPEKGFWSAQDMGDLQFFIYILTKIFERQNGNIMLVRYISEMMNMANEATDFLTEKCEQIKKMWSVSKAILIKAFLRNRMPDMEKLNASAKAALIEEKQFWEKFIYIFSKGEKMSVSRVIF